jgi:hypothetical protein
VVDIPPIKFEDVKVASVEPRYKMWEYRGFQIFLSYAADRRHEVFEREMLKQQSLVQHLTHDLGTRNVSLKVLEGLVEPTTPWRRSVGLRKARGAVEIIKTENRPKIAVMCCHQAVMEEIRGEFQDRRAVCVYHNSNPRNKARAIKRFMGEHECNVLVFHRDVAEHEPGLLDFSGIQEMLIVEADWNPHVNAAAILRMHKRGQQLPQRVRFVGLENSIDSKLQMTMKQHTRRIVTGFFDDEKETPKIIDPFAD